MYLEAKKIDLIEKVLKVESEPVLIELETILNNYQRNLRNKLTISDFIGIISNEEAMEMHKAIAETCENIDSDDWK